MRTIEIGARFSSFTIVVGNDYVPFTFDSRSAVFAFNLRFPNSFSVKPDSPSFGGHIFKLRCESVVNLLQAGEFLARFLKKYLLPLTSS